ncbi:MAG: diacylglycerol/polyprenol kinase family protein [Bacteroidota bacterium]
MSDSPPLISYAAELKRKAIHLGALVLPAGILVLGRTVALWLLGPLATLAHVADVLRVRVHAVHRLITWLFEPIMRPEEQPPFGGPVVVNGATWMCVSAALCAFFFPEPVAASALAMLMVGDGAAAVVGRRYGRTRYPFSPKSVEGSVAFFVTGFLAAIPFGVLPEDGVALPALAVGAATAAVVEALPVPLNDNVRVPLVAGAVMLLLG